MERRKQQAIQVEKTRIKVKQIESAIDCGADIQDACRSFGLHYDTYRRHKRMIKSEEKINEPK